MKHWDFKRMAITLTIPTSIFFIYGLGRLLFLILGQTPTDPIAPFLTGIIALVALGAMGGLCWILPYRDIFTWFIHIPRNIINFYYHNGEIVWRDKIHEENMERMR